MTTSGLHEFPAREAVRCPLPDRGAVARLASVVTAPADSHGGRQMERADAASLRAGMTAIWVRFRTTVPTRLAALDDAAIALLGGTLDPELRRQAEREAHKLAGSVGTFGFSEGSRLARSLELLLAGTEPLTADDALRLSNGAVELRSILDVETPPETTAAAGEVRTRLLILSADPELVERIGLEAEGRGLEVMHVADAAAVLAATTENNATAVLLDLDSGAGLSLLADLSGLDPVPPTVVIAARDSLEERVAAAQAGAAAFLRKPALPGRVIDLVTHSLAAEGLAGARIMVVDDDPHILDIVRTVLSAHGVEVVPVGDGRGVLAELARLTPDLVILDHDMPGFTGIEICRALRADPRYQMLPVLFLSARRDPDTLQGMFAAGADDYVPKPVLGRELVARIRNRLERSRLHATVSAGHGPGGLPGRDRASGEAERLVQLALRRGEPLAVALVAPDDMDRLRQKLGHAGGDEVLSRVGVLLQSLLPAGDLVAWWGGDAFLVTFFGESAADAALLLRPALDAISRETLLVDGAREALHLSAGIAEAPADGADFATAAARAGSLLAGARSEAAASSSSDVVNRLKTSTGDAAGRETEVVDVVIVEDDPVIADLLAHALGTRGYTVRRIADGDEAVNLLAGAAPPLHARVMLLDVDLPGRSGLAVLRELGRSGVLDRTRCVMLTVRSGEQDVLRSLELGAVDHVAKPFSVPVLLQRVHALLDR